jgi:hypothetical protein
MDGQAEAAGWDEGIVERYVCYCCKGEKCKRRNDEEYRRDIGATSRFRYCSGNGEEEVVLKLSDCAETLWMVRKKNKYLCAMDKGFAIAMVVFVIHCVVYVRRESALFVGWSFHMFDNELIFG